MQRATIHENFLRDNFPSADIRVYATQDEANADLASGRVDLVLADSVALNEGFLKTDAGKGFEFVGPDFTDPKWFGDGAGIAIRKGEQDLVDAFNKAIAQIRCRRHLRGDQRQVLRLRRLRQIAPPEACRADQTTPPFARA